MRRPTVTQLVDFSKCEKLAILKRSKAEHLDQARQAATMRGEREHARLERQTVVDGRCFVASFAYGPQAWQTQALRHWRDERLLLTVWGRALTRLYYMLSPWAVAALRRCPNGARWARALVDFALSKVLR